MRKFLAALIWIPVALLVLLFAVTNRQPVVISLDPFSAENPALSVQGPLFLMLMGALMVGIILGGLTDWLRQSPLRREARHSRAKVRELEQELARLRAHNAPPQSSLVDNAVAALPRTPDEL